MHGQSSWQAKNGPMPVKGKSNDSDDRQAQYLCTWWLRRGAQRNEVSTAVEQQPVRVRPMQLATAEVNRWARQCGLPHTT